MTFLNDYSNLAKSPIFWVFSAIVFLGFCMIVFLTYRAKDKVVSLVLSIPISLLSMFIISMLCAPLLVGFGDIASGLIKGSISAFSFSTIFFLIRKYAVKFVRKAFQWNVQKPR
ncbi:MAG: hypothetical protein KAR08_01515 [Candidatus Heimdallarchaeota archaeon]|nr:hypothetical protein [Candidatus Heimdallarchaeota archaeon]